MTPAFRRFRTSCLVLIALALAGCGGGDGAEPPQPVLTGAQPFVVQRVESGIAAVRDDPRSGAAWGRLGEIYDVNGFAAEAVECYERARELAPEDWRWSYNLGIVRLDTDPARAYEAFERVVEQAPDYAPARFYLGYAAMVRDDLKAALEHFGKALEIAPELANAQLGLARLALSAGDPEAARKHAEAAARVAPDESAPFHHLATIYDRLGQPELAAQAARRAESSAIPPDPRNGFGTMADPVRDETTLRGGATVDWLGKNAWRLLALGHGADAVELLRRATRVDPDSTELRLALARVLAATGRLEEARMNVDAVLSAHEDLAEAHAERGTILARTGETDAALAAFRRALEIDPTLHEVRGNLGALLLESGRTDEGIEALRATVTVLPGNADARYNLAAALLRADRRAEARRVLDELIEQRPDYAPGRFLQATMEALAGRLEASVAGFREVLALDPGHSEARIQLARSLWELGRFGEALGTLDEAGRVDPSNAAIARELAWGLATCPDARLRNGARALEIARILCDTTGYRDPTHLDTLAAAQAETGDYTEAVKTLDRGLELVEQTAHDVGPDQRAAVDDFLGQLRARRKLYASGAPYRDGGS